MTRRILVTGGTGLVGMALQKITIDDPNPNPNSNWIFIGSKDGDLRNYNETRAIFEKHKPTHVIHLAARVGGLFANISNPADFYRDNMLINDNVLFLSHTFGVEKVVSCLSTCIFPDKTSYPMDETMIHNGEPHESNYGYAYAKRMIDVMNRTMKQQYNRNYTSIVPTNIYGPFDNFNLESSHVIPGLIHKCFLAKKNNTKLVIAGSGIAQRQFIYSYDLAKLIVRVLDTYNDVSPLILSVTEEVDIKYLVECIVDSMGFTGEIEWDTSKSDGQLKKTVCNGKLINLFGEIPFTELHQGISETVEWFISNYKTLKKF